MSEVLLKNYGIHFNYLSLDGRKHPFAYQVVVSDLSYHLCNYLSEQPFIEYLEGELLVALETALNGPSQASYDGGVTVFLKIGSTTSFLYDLGSPTQFIPIPTDELRDLILLWINFLKKCYA